ncbi:dihydrodipicolinate synthase family protein [Ponticoccus sp. SC2-23]|uniref:dihydrodipicolinate synthase family protein n=1 Tax=Alexandriicola marinus TaxID=2081710 RepID=UPI000FD8B203|nr:dihydrodipicolinate synthase family protein [Alexandriicola marinus]MBM1219784.1 dihydrodipicolinate synthase family protein [Ponticoccus sp. SC6-9]MBM1223144.1 dihydrodipicolinate synthase family protein [Ponticoccus sp. SC6-15]MBM1229597.1 dihydrodipicolinate synthase family protein [Ponticoccus sp. SC6-38]MBM1232110.1 dihydrodipicolinate synthase family protein [Ponticoccus sp. SC6-45]MBM1237940.1 dihydrodipicolinate synthase family protein [Ponticoccus sp. SC6-49]MBM1241121.1 dihydrodi
MTDRKTELFVPVITPFAADLTVDTDRLVAHAKALLEAGAHGLAPFGTTSEANSLSVTERMAALEAMLSAGIAPDRLIPGTGCCAAADTIALSAHATGLGCRGVLMLPPFYYKGVSDEGVFAAYAQVIEAVGAGLRVYLYHIPQMSGVPITLPLIDRLIDAFPGVIAGLKDSSGSWENTASVIAAFPGIDTYSASESLIPENVAAGGAGCISASSNVNARGIRALIDGLGGPDHDALHAQVSGVRRIFEGLPLIPAIKAAVAAQHDDPAFANVRPPFTLTGPDNADAIAEAVRLSGPQW